MPAVALIRSDIEPVSDRILPDAGRYFTHVWLREDKRCPRLIARYPGAGVVKFRAARPLLRALCEIEDMRAVISPYEKVATFRSLFSRSRDGFRTAVDYEGRAEWRHKCEFRLKSPSPKKSACVLVPA